MSIISLIVATLVSLVPASDMPNFSPDYSPIQASEQITCENIRGKVATAQSVYNTNVYKDEIDDLLLRRANWESNRETTEFTREASDRLLSLSAERIQIYARLIALREFEADCVFGKRDANPDWDAIKPDSLLMTDPQSES